MSLNIKGFRPNDEAEETSDLERELGVNFVKKEDEPFLMYVGKAVRIHVVNGNIDGIYCGVNDRNFLVVAPSVQGEEFPNTEAGKTKIRFFWSERPNLVKYEVVLGISSIRKGYLDWIVQNVGRETPEIREDSLSQEQSDSQQL